MIQEIRITDISNHQAAIVADILHRDKQRLVSRIEAAAQKAVDDYLLGMSIKISNQSQFGHPEVLVKVSYPDPKEE